MLIALTQGKFAQVDREDFPLIEAYRWYPIENGRYQKICYAMTQVKQPDGTRKVVYMHRVILQAPPGAEVDHKDHNGLNNTRQNIRLVTHQQNTLRQRKQVGTSSQFRGVSYTASKKLIKRWYARLSNQGHHYCLGYFLTEEEAAMAYDRAALNIWGPGAKLNFPSL